MNAMNHPSANNRLDPIADAFALRFDQAGFCLTDHRNILNIRCTTGHSFTRAVRLIGIGNALTHRPSIQIPIAS